MFKREKILIKIRWYLSVSWKKRKYKNYNKIIMRQMMFCKSPKNIMRWKKRVYNNRRDTIYKLKVQKKNNN